MTLKRLSRKRLLTGRLSVKYNNFGRWYMWGFSRYWADRLFYFQIGKFYIVYDCRKSWLEDMVNGNAE